FYFTSLLIFSVLFSNIFLQNLYILLKFPFVSPHFKKPKNPLKSHYISLLNHSQYEYLPIPKNTILFTQISYVILKQITQTSLLGTSNTVCLMQIKVKFPSLINDMTVGSTSKQDIDETPPKPYKSLLEIISTPQLSSETQP
ncbi:hypothetical protein IMG5_091500, partial [Ichthyophthirius multifiliis]